MKIEKPFYVLSLAWVLTATLAGIYLTDPETTPESAELLGDELPTAARPRALPVEYSSLP